MTDRRSRSCTSCRCADRGRAVKADAMKSEVAVALDLDLLCTATLAVLHSAALSTTTSCLPTYRAIRHVVFEGQIRIIGIGRHLHVRDGEVLVLCCNLRAASVVLGSLANDGFAVELGSFLHATLATSSVEGALAVET